MKLTKADLEKLANELTDDTSVSYFTQEELDAIVQARLGKEKPKLDNAHSRIAQLEAEIAEQQRKINEGIEAANLEGKSELEKLQAELQRTANAHKATLEELNKREQALQEISTKRQGDWLDSQLQSMLLESGADPRQIADINLVAKTRLKNILQVTQENGSFKLSAVNPVTLQEVDVKQTIRAWLDERPNFKRAKSPGGGAQPAGPSLTNPTTDPFEGLSHKEAIAKALRQSLSRPGGIRGKVNDGDPNIHGSS